MTITDAKIKITEQVKFYVKRAEELYGVKLNPTICFKLKGTSAGTAQAATGKLRFNLTALQVEGGWDHLINNTVPHEVAHLVQYTHPSFPKDRRNNPPHGRYWQKVMRDFGVKAQRCHSLALPKARVSSQPKYPYHCACRTFEISRLIHTKMQNGQVRRCLKCRVSLTFGPKAEVKKESPYHYV